MNFKKFIKNSKAISPIFATLILIAIAVIAGVVVYMFTSGTLATMTGGGTAAQEKISVQAASFKLGATPAGTVTVYLRANRRSTATVNGLIVKDSSGEHSGSYSSYRRTWHSNKSTGSVTGQLETLTGAYSGTATLSGNLTQSQ